MPSIYGPTLIDEFSFIPYVKAIETKIRGTELSELPITVGIYGAWGSGKTSFMLQLKDALESSSGGQSSLPTIWFDAWKYDRIEDVRSAFIFNILSELEKKSSGTARKKVQNTVQNAARLTWTYARRTSISIGLPGASLQLPSAENILKDWKQSHSLRTVVDTFTKSFSDAVNSFLNQYTARKQNAKLVIFIDDLDRCLPDNVVMILEALKLFLDESRCIFVIGADRHAVQSAVMLRYGSGLPNTGREYLDKIVNYPFTLPVPSRDLVERKFRVLAAKAGVDESVLKLFAFASMANPRLFSRLLSAWEIVVSMSDDLALNLQDNNQRSLLALATAIRIRFPLLHELCRRQPDKFLIFLGCCHNPDRAKDDKTLIKEGAAEYRGHLDDPAVQTYISKAFNEVDFLSKMKEGGATTLVDAAFSLALDPNRLENSPHIG